MGTHGPCTRTFRLQKPFASNCFLEFLQAKGSRARAVGTHGWVIPGPTTVRNCWPRGGGPLGLRCFGIGMLRL